MNTEPDSSNRRFQHLRMALVLVLVLVLVLLGAGMIWRCVVDSHERPPSSHDPASARDFTKGPTRARSPSAPLRAALSGTVFAREGSPIAGAHVCAIADPVHLRGREARPRCVLTDATGHYRIEDLWPLRTRVHASAARYRPGRAQAWIPLHAVREHDNVDIVLEPGGVRLAGLVHDLAGGTIEGAFVSASADRLGEEQDLALGVTDEAGRFELWVAPGRVRTQAWAVGYSRAQRVYVAPSELVELFLLPESVLVGRVVDASTGTPISDAEVWPGQHRIFRFDRGPQLLGPLVRTDEQGRFRIGGLEPGMYEPGAVIDLRYGQAPELVHLGLGETSGELEIRVHALPRVLGRVRVAETGQPCPKPSVHLRGPDGTRRARTDVEGNVELLALQPGRYEVDVKCEGFVAEPEYPPIELGASSSVELAWEVHVGAALRGVVVDARGRPLPRMLVNGISLGEAPTRVLPAAIHPTDAEGHFAMLGVSPGRYQLRASGPDGDSEALDVEVRGPNELTDLRLVVPEGGSLRGRVIDGRASPRPQVEILLERSDERRATANARSNDLGEFDIAWLEPGPYRVSVVGDPSSEAVQIHAGEQAQVELEVATHDGVITGRVLDSDGAPVSDAFVAAIAMTEQATAPLAAQRAAALARSNWSAIAEPTLTDVEGRFTSSGLPPGEYIVHAHRKGGGTAVADSVALGSDVSLRLSVTGSLAGTVALADGTLLEVFDITLTALEQGFVRRDDFFRTKGAWSFGELPAARLRVQVEAPEGTATVEVSLGEGEAREQLEIVLQPRVTLTGRIVDLDSGEPLAGMLVTVTGGLAAETSSTRNGLSDAQGRFRVLAPSGEVTLFIGPEGGTAGSDYEYLWTPRSIPADPSTQELGDIGLIAKRLHDGERPGDIGFELAPPSAGIDPSERRAELALVHPGGPAAAAGLRVGDVIEQVDGKSVVGRDFDRFPTLTRVPAGTVLSLVTADGRTVALTVGAA